MVGVDEEYEVRVGIPVRVQLRDLLADIVVGEVFAFVQSGAQIRLDPGEVNPPDRGARDNNVNAPLASHKTCDGREAASKQISITEVAAYDNVDRGTMLQSREPLLERRVAHAHSHHSHRSATGSIGRGLDVPVIIPGGRATQSMMPGNRSAQAISSSQYGRIPAASPK